MKLKTKVIRLGFNKGIFTKNQPGFGLLAGDLTGVAGTVSSCDSDMDRNNESLRRPAGGGTGISLSLRDADLEKNKKQNHLKSLTDKNSTGLVRLDQKKNGYHITSNTSENMSLNIWQRFAYLITRNFRDTLISRLKKIPKFQ